MKVTFAKILKKITKQVEKITNQFGSASSIIMGRNVPDRDDKIYAANTIKKVIKLFTIIVIFLSLFFIIIVITDNASKVEKFGPDNALVGLSFTAHIYPDTNQDVFQLDLEEAYLITTNVPDDGMYCLEKIQIQTVELISHFPQLNYVEYTIEEENDHNSIRFENYCYEVFENQHWGNWGIRNNAPIKSFTVPIAGSESTANKYPFDKRSIFFIVFAEVKTPDGRLITVIPKGNISFTSGLGKQVTGFRNVNIVKGELIIDGGETLERGCGLYVCHSFTRPRWRITAAISLLVVLLLFMMMMLGVKELGSALEVAVGILFGLWSIREVILPPDFGRSGLADGFLTSLYVAFAVISVVRFISKPSFKKMDKIIKGAKKKMNNNKS